MTDDTDTPENLEGDIPDETPEGSDSESEQDDRVSNADPADSPDESAEETIVYKRADLEKLRQENGRYRQRAQQADELAHRLHTELVRATGRLADPSDLTFDEDHLADAGNMVAAIDELLTRKPHLASRRPVGEIGQGPSPAGGSVDLAAILRGKTG